MGRIYTNQTGGRPTSSKGGRLFKQDPISNLQAMAQDAGLEAEANKIIEGKSKLSFLQRVGKGLGALNPAEAVLTGTEKGIGSGIAKYTTGIVKGVSSAITGTDYEGERRTFSDVAEKMGVENAIAKFGIGLVGDIFLDPSTYFGGAIAKGITKGVSVGSGSALKGIGKVAPKTEEGLRLAGQGAKEAFGKAFKYGYGTSKGLPEKALTIQSKLAKTKEGIVASNLARLGTGTLSKSQQDELVQRLLAGKKAEFGARTFELPKLAKTSPEIEEQIQNLAMMRESLLSNPARRLAKYSGRSGSLPEVTGKGKSLFGTKGDDISSELGFQYSEDARKAFDDYVKTRNQFNIAADKLRKNKQLFKDEKELNEFLNLTEVKNIRHGAKSIGKNTALEGASPEMESMIFSQSARSQKFAKSAGIQDPYEIYFPGLKNDSVKKFIEGTKQLRVGSEGYMKQFKNILKDDELVKNPAEAFAKREFDIAKDNIIRSELNSIVKNYGKPLNAFKTEDEALKAGYKLVKEKGMFGKSLGYITETDKKFIDNLISPEFTTIDTLAKATGFDAITSLFKRSVTGLFAPFHVRNFASGMIQNFEVLGKDALNPINISSGQKAAWKLATGDKSIFANKIVKLGGKEINLGKAFKTFEERFGTSSQYISDIADATKGAGNIPGKILSKESLKTTVKTVGLGQQSIPFRGARAIGNYIETQQKATAFITALGQGKTVEQALDLATRAGFDYRALTALESKVLRRIIPFYSFTRKNMELQLRTLGENPERINQILATLNNTQELGGKLTEEEKKNLPDYLKEGTYLVFGRNEKGQPLIAPGLGTPVEQPGQLLGNNPLLRLGSMINPIFKVPLEKAADKDFFYRKSVGGKTTGQDLSDIVDAKYYAKAPKFLKDFLRITEVQKKKKDGTPYTSYVGDPYRLHILRNLPTSRGVSYLNNIYNEDQSAETKTLNLGTGLKPRPIDFETVEYFRNRDNQRALEDLLIRAGVIKRFESTYTPKTNR